MKPTNEWQPGQFKDTLRLGEFLLEAHGRDDQHGWCVCRLDDALRQAGHAETAVVATSRGRRTYATREAARRAAMRAAMAVRKAAK